MFYFVKKIIFKKRTKKKQTLVLILQGLLILKSKSICDNNKNEQLFLFVQKKLKFFHFPRFVIFDDFW